MLPSSRSNSFAALSEEHNEAQPERNARARKRKARKLSDRRSTGDAAQVAELPKLSRLSMGPTGTDGSLKDGEVCIQKLTDSHLAGRIIFQMPIPVQSCCISMHVMGGVRGQYLNPCLKGQREEAKALAMCEYPVPEGSCGGCKPCCACRGYLLEAAPTAVKQ